MEKQNFTKTKYKASSEFILFLNKENIERLGAVIAVILVIISFQVVGYSLANNDDFNISLIEMKLLFVVIALIILYVFRMMKKYNSLFTKHSEKIIYLATFCMLIAAIINTFEAQRITSDISIYIMILFAIVSSVRMRPVLTASQLIIIYSIFVVYLPSYQFNKNYVLAHIMNGLIINILAYIISRMFYNYSVRDYEDKLDIKNKNKELKYLSEKDDLTGLYNKRMSNKLLSGLIKDSNDTEKSLYLSVIDLDRFKNINDKYGHSYGDEVLKLIAKSIEKNIRETDIAVRYGGDEFLIFFQDVAQKEVDNILTRLLDEISNTKFKDSTLSFSCGIAKWQGETKEELFERADSYMYKVKSDGRNNILS